jgi:endonuclease/exonuclease/phosphatase family metal-dependent hydrolase
MTANLLAGGADPGQIVGLVRDRHVDVLALQEFTPHAEQALDAAGIAALLPYRVSGAVDGTAGSGLYSRYPITDQGVRENPGRFLQARGTVTVPGALPVAVESVHPVPPHVGVTTANFWKGLAEEPAATPDGPVRVLLGDFNSTLDHVALRRILATGYRDAAATVGEGFAPTWPYYGDQVRRTPKVTIDHVLADGRVGVVDVTVRTVRRTDHRCVVATLVLPGPTA